MILALTLAILAQDKAADTRERWLPPAMTVTLAGEKTALEAIEEIRKQTGLAIDAEGVDDAARFPFDWKERNALEALSDICRLRGQGEVVIADRIALNGAGTGAYALSHWKQFRADVTDVMMTTMRTVTKVTRSLQVDIAMVALPGTTPFHRGPFLLEEAADDTGLSLMAGVITRGDEYAEGEDAQEMTFIEPRYSKSTTAQPLAAWLKAPAADAKKIARLRGRVLYTFPLRQVEASVPVSDLTEEKELALGPAVVRVLQYERKGAIVNLRLRLPKRTAKFSHHPPQIDLLTAEGEKVNSVTGGGGPEEMHLTIHVMGAEPVATLRISAFVGRSTIAVPVDFRDIPLPVKK